MKQTVKTSRTAGYLEKIFRALNEAYYEGKLEEPVITIQSTPRAYGHVTVAKAWARSDGENRHELNVGAGTLDRPIEHVVATIQHEIGFPKDGTDRFRFIPFRSAFGTDCYRYLP